jgi:hypothetical protein
LVSDFENKDITFETFHQGIIFDDSENKDQLSIHDNKLVKQVLKHKGHIKGIGKESFK